MTVRGLFETHLTVADVRRSTAFYRDVVGLPVALELPKRGAAFHWIGAPGRAMLGLWSIGSAPMNMQLHVAFDVALEDVLAAPPVLSAQGVEPLSFFAEPAGEPSVIGWMPAAAVYFRDPDGHLIEYLAMLDGPPRPELGIVPWSQSGYDAPAGSLRIEAYTGPREELRPLFELAEDSAAELDGYLSAGDVLVARRGERIVGHVQLVDGGTEIKNLAVAPEQRRRGVASRLVEAALARGGARTVRVATAATDVDNLRFYQRLGFRLRSIERDAFVPERGYDATVRDRVWLDLDVPA
jgi:lactoylglutathione lyase